MDLRVERFVFDGSLEEFLGTLSGRFSIVVGASYSSSRLRSMRVKLDLSEEIELRRLLMAVSDQIGSHCEVVISFPNEATTSAVTAHTNEEGALVIGIGNGFVDVHFKPDGGSFERVIDKSYQGAERSANGEGDFGYDIKSNRRIEK